jgi:hypothetical protein
MLKLGVVVALLMSIGSAAAASFNCAAATTPLERLICNSHTAEANQFRLFLHAGAYWLLWSMRRATPKRSTWRVMQFDTLRLRLIKIAARVVELKTQLKIHLPSSAPDQAIFALLLARLPRLVT